jgi:hypothetical protein
MATRKHISDLTIKRLYALSGNRCAFPGCNVQFVSSEDETNVSNICHIEAAEEGGERYNPNSNDEERRSFENLILLCPNHHAITNDVQRYTVEVLRRMKTEHEDKIRRLLSEKDVLTRHPSALNRVISIIGKSVFEIDQTTEPHHAPNIDAKISYNNIVRYKSIIQAYSAYHSKINVIYEEIERSGSVKKQITLMNINTLYLKERWKYQTIEAIRNNADNIIDNVKHELWNVINNSSNGIDLDYEVIEMSVLIILVDAFMRCNILEEPSNDNQ